MAFNRRQSESENLTEPMTVICEKTVPEMPALKIETRINLMVKALFI